MSPLGIEKCEPTGDFWTWIAPSMTGNVPRSMTPRASFRDAGGGGGPPGSSALEAAGVEGETATPSPLAFASAKTGGGLTASLPGPALSVAADTNGAGDAARGVGALPGSPLPQA